jgi:protein gp37
MNVPFFFKQWGGFNKKATGRELNGGTFDEMPEPQLRQKNDPLALEFNSSCE